MCGKSVCVWLIFYKKKAKSAVRSILSCINTIDFTALKKKNKSRHTKNGKQQ